MVAGLPILQHPKADADAGVSWKMETLRSLGVCELVPLPDIVFLFPMFSLFQHKHTHVGAVNTEVQA